jgi:hypothetical protein
VAEGQSGEHVVAKQVHWVPDQLKPAAHWQKLEIGPLHVAGEEQVQVELPADDVEPKPHAVQGVWPP